MSELNATAIQGVQVVPLRVITDERGAVLPMLRVDSPYFDRFGEIYFSEVNPGVVKGWKRHQLNTQRFAVPVGRIKLVVFDGRDGSPTVGSLQTFILGRPAEYKLIILPAMLWYGFQCISPAPAILANCADLPHDPTESEQIGLDEGGIDYEW